MAKFTVFSYEFRRVLWPSTPISFEMFSSAEIEENYKRKQELFGEFFEKENFPEYFDYIGKPCKVQLLWQFNGIIVFQLERQGWHKQSLNFKSNKIPDNPWIDILIDNREKRQFIAVRKNTTAFKYAHTISQILGHNISNWLRNKYGLEVAINAQYESKVFWDIYKRHYLGSGIERLQFNFPFPNKDWISENIKSLQDFGKERNGAVRLGLEADRGEALIFEKNEGNQAIVNACSGTGVDILIKPKNHRVIHVVKEMNPIEIDMSDNTLQKIVSPQAAKSLYEDHSNSPYEKAGEFLNKCKNFYA
ncbi:MAG: hypothetical protein E7074_04575 [Bacteroidales bacterium]|nr:hypothetical protein [Bacteroidales bacterium]